MMNGREGKLRGGYKGKANGDNHKDEGTQFNNGRYHGIGKPEMDSFYGETSFKKRKYSSHAQFSDHKTLHEWW